jgi:cytochrome c554/c'-like protein
MTWTRRTVLLLSVLLPGSVLLAQAPERMTPRKVKELAEQINPHGYTSHDVCGACHQDIHNAWEDSAHARAVSNPGFQEDLARSVARHGGEAKKLCLSCHAPTTRFTGATDPKDPLVMEGVGCDFCHTVKAVNLSGREDPFQTTPGPLKYGPFAYAPSPAHPTVFSLLHRNSPLLCAGCHEFRTPNGFPALTTYTEWKAGPYPAQGVSCQDCHMALVMGETARKEVKTRQQGTYRFINLHRLVGGGSLGQLRLALDLKLVTAEVRGDEGHVAAQISNTAAGHKVPTGLPSKRLVLTVRGLSANGEETSAESRIYERQVIDKRGAPIHSDGELFFAAAKVVSDNRLAPGEAARGIPVSHPIRDRQSGGHANLPVPPDGLGRRHDPEDRSGSARAPTEVARETPDACGRPLVTREILR